MKEKLDILTTEANVFSGAYAALLIKTTAEHIKICLSYIHLDLEFSLEQY